MFGKTKSIVVVTASPVIFFSNWYGALFELGECGLMRNPYGIGSNCFSFAGMLPRLRQNHDWCTDGPCAGALKPRIPWSICDGSSHAKSVILYFLLNDGR